MKTSSGDSPEWCETRLSWKDDDSPERNRVNTGCLGGRFEEVNGESRGCWTRAGALRAFRKPENATSGDRNPFHEYVASRIAQELRVRVPPVELTMLPGGPVALVYEIPKALSFAHLVSCGYCKVLCDPALSKLEALAEVIVLDALVGVQNRPLMNGNHMYSIETSSWASIDYSDSFHDEFIQDYDPPFVDAVRASWDSTVRATLAVAKNIDPEMFEKIAFADPEPYASRDERKRILGFLRKRQNEVYDIVRNWLQHRTGSKA